MKVEIGKRLKMLRLEKGFTQKELAGISGGLDYTYIGKIERGEQLPSLKFLIKIGEALSVPINYFFCDESSSVTYRIAASELETLVKDRKGRELLRALKVLHEDDIPLVTEIVRVLNRHRNAAKRTLSDAPDEGILMAAEEGTIYRRS